MCFSGKPSFCSNSTQLLTNFCQPSLLSISAKYLSASATYPGKALRSVSKSAVGLFNDNGDLSRVGRVSWRLVGGGADNGTAVVGPVSALTDNTLGKTGGETVPAAGIEFVPAMAMLDDVTGITMFDIGLVPLLKSAP